MSDKVSVDGKFVCYSLCTRISTREANKSSINVRKVRKKIVRVLICTDKESAYSTETIKLCEFLSGSVSGTNSSKGIVNYHC